MDVICLKKDISEIPQYNSRFRVDFQDLPVAVNCLVMRVVPQCTHVALDDTIAFLSLVEFKG